MGENKNMAEQRKNKRYGTSAKVRIEGTQDENTMLKDISVTGCRVECPSYAEVEINSQYNMEIIPESTAKIGAFKLLVESKWIKTGGNSYEIGFFILKSPEGKQFQRYVDYLSWRYSQGNSITGENNVGLPLG